MNTVLLNLIQTPPPSFVPNNIEFAFHELEDAGFSSSQVGKFLEELRSMQNHIIRQFKRLSSSDRNALHARLAEQSGFGLAGFPSFADVVRPIAIDPIVTTRSLPTGIEIAVDPGMTTDLAVQTIGDKIAGLGGGVLASMHEKLSHVAPNFIQVFVAFSNRLKVARDLFGGGKLDQAIASTFEAVFNLGIELGAWGTALIVNITVDVVFGVIGGLLFARPLTPGERDFAHSIFHGKIHLAPVRVAVFTFSTGLAAANVIYMPSMDLSDGFTEGLFAHELTHVYQDQRPGSPGTIKAAHELLSYYFGGSVEPYEYALDASTKWNELGMEQQAQVVQDYQEHVNGHDPIARSSVCDYKRILQDAGLF